VTTIFTETLVSPKVARTLAREAGVRTEALDPIEGLTKAEVARGETYVSVMDDNLSKLRAALGCT
jgi:zinc transport system substrate-binding protein